MIIYSISDLKNKSFDDEEIDIVSKSLIYSLIIGMFRQIKSKLSDKEIISICKKDNWFENYQWTKLQKESYKKHLDKVFYNLYRFGPIKCSNTSDEFLLRYGFSIKTNKKQKSNKK